MDGVPKITHNSVCENYASVVLYKKNAQKQQRELEMNSITIVTKRENWQNAVTCLEPVPENIIVFCREYGALDLRDGRTMKMQHDMNLAPETVNKFLNQLKVLSSDVRAEPYVIGLV